MQLTKTIKNDRKLSWKYFSRRKKETAKVPFQWKKLGTCLGQSVRKQKFGCLYFASSVLITNTSKRWWDTTNQERKGLEGISVSQEYSVWYVPEELLDELLAFILEVSAIQWVTRDCKMANNKKEETPNSLASIPRTVTEQIIKLLVNI